MSRRRLRTAAALVSALAAAVLVWTSFVPPAAAYWLEVRRKGPAGIVAASRGALINAPQRWRYRLDVLDGKPLAGLTLEIGRRPLAGGDTDVSVRLTDKRGKLLAALARVKGKLTVRLHGKRPTTDNTALFAPVPKLGVPLALWAIFELMPAYRVQLEGEFSGTALIRMTPDYTSAAGLPPLKLGVSKRNYLPTVVEVIDLKGRPTARLLWMKPQQVAIGTKGAKGKLQAKRMVAGALRIRTMKRVKPLDFSLLSYDSGARCGARFGPRALADK